MHLLARYSREHIGAHQAALSYVPDGDFDRGIHTHSFSRKYARYNTYDVMPTGEGIWSLVVEGNKTVRMTEQELFAHPRWRNFSNLKDSRGLEHPPMPGWLAAPIVGTREEFLGVVQLSDKFVGDFTIEDEQRLANVALHISPTFAMRYLLEMDTSSQQSETDVKLKKIVGDLEELYAHLKRG